VGALAAAKRKAHVVADVVAHAQTDFAAKPMANAPALARSDAAAEPKAHVVADLVAIARTNLSAKPMADASADARALASSVVAADAGALAPALARADGGPVEQTNAKTHALADGDARRPHGGARIFADAAAFFTAEFEADKGADAPPDPESLSGAVE